MMLTNPRFSTNRRLQAAAGNSPAIRCGQRDHVAVAILQQAFVDLGLPMPRSTRPDRTMDGIFGDETEKAVRAFQKAHGLLDSRGRADGIVGRNTLAKLDRAKFDRRGLAGPSHGAPTSPSEEQARAIQGEEIERIAQMIVRALRRATSMFEARSTLARVAIGAYVSLGVDAIVLSFSGSGFTPWVVGGGLGIELLCFGRLHARWVRYVQGGLGVGTVGGGGTVQAGLVWNLPEPDSYTKWFIELAFAVTAPIGGTGAVFFEPHDVLVQPITASDLADLLNGGFERPCGFKVGAGLGSSPGVSELFEYYVRL